MRMDSLSKTLLAKLDIDSVKEKRRGNAEYLHNSLLNMAVAKPLISDPDFGRDCPLFVPVVVEAAYRDRLRDHLVSNVCTARFIGQFHLQSSWMIEREVV